MKSALYSEEMLIMNQAQHIPFGLWLFLGSILVFYGWAVFSLRVEQAKWKKQQWGILFIGLAILVPVNLLGIKVSTHLQSFEALSAIPYVFIAFLHIPIIVLMMGFLGLETAFIFGILSGILQVLLRHQDLFVIAVLAGIPVVLAGLFHFQRKRYPQWDRKLPWALFSITYLGLFPLILILTTFKSSFLSMNLAWNLPVYSVYIWLSLLPGFVITLLLYWLIQSRFSSFWRFDQLIKQSTIDDNLKPYIDQIRLLSNGTYDTELLSRPHSAFEKGLHQALERLRKNLQFRHEAHSRLLSLDPSHYSKEGYDIILTSILRAALTRDASSARLLLLDKVYQGGLPHIRSRFGQGENTRLYAYLDARILDRMGQLDQLILTDIKIDQYFGLSADSPYPQSIIALALMDKGCMHGLLWVGFEQKKWFSPDDIQFYKELAFRASVAISTKQETQQLLGEKTIFESSLNSIPHAVFIINNLQEITFMNDSAKTLAREADGLLKKEKGKHYFLNKKVLDFLQEGRYHQLFDRGVSLGNSALYDLERYPLIIDNKKEGAVIFFVNNAWLSQINQQRTEFINNISHDLQSPVKMIKGHLILLQRMGNLNKEQQTYVKLIEENAESMSRLVNKMLNIERLDMAETLDYVRFNFQEKADDVLRLLSPIAMQKKVTIIRDFGQMPTPYISADQTLIQQAIYNLVENAIKFSPLGGEVKVLAEKDASWLHFCVVDHGKGIAPIDQPNLFKRFYHLEDEDRFDNTVSGMGLAIVKTIAEKHGGSVRVESQLGEGSRFYLDIPIHKLN